MKHFLVLGATSAIAQAFCRAQAGPGARFWLVGRNEARLRIVAADLITRGAAAEVRVIEPGSFPSLKGALDEGFAQGDFDIFLAAQGSLPPQEEFEAAPDRLAEFFQTNAVDLMAAALIVAAKFERRGQGACVILGSVAGDRGRRGNYIYGAAKSALDTFCEGLRQRLGPKIPVVLVKPGPVDTPMTAHLKKGALFTTPEKVAGDIARAIGRGTAVVYSPFYWRWIMALIRMLPRGVVKRLRA